MAIPKITNNLDAGDGVNGTINPMVDKINYWDSSFYPKLDASPLNGGGARRGFPDGNTIISSPSFVSSDFIEVEEGRTYIIQGLTAGFVVRSYVTAFYDENGENGYTIPLNSQTIVDASTLKFTVPQGSSKVCIFGQITEAVNWKIGIGSTKEQADSSQITPFALENARIKQLVERELLDSENAAFIGGVARVYAQIPFDQGSIEPQFLDTIVGETSGATYNMRQYELHSGSFANGDAAGVLILDAGKNYLNSQYSSGENLQVGGVTIAVKTSVPASGRWWPIIDTGHDAINVLNIENTAGGGGFFVNYKISGIGATTFLAVADESFAIAGYQVGASVGNTFSVVTVVNLKLAANNDVRGESVDWRDLNNAIDTANVWFFGILRL